MFIIEAVVKIIALGFCASKGTYLRSAWNVIDFAIVVAALLQFWSNFIGLSSFSLRSLRMLRILRPLRTIETIPSLRKQVQALLKSVAGLINVAVFLIFLFALFAIMGL